MAFFTIDNHFLQQFEQRFGLRKKGFSSRENSIGVSLFSNLLGSLLIQPIEPAVVYENCTTSFQWSLFESCSESDCFFSDSSCGYSEGFALLVLTEWDVNLTRSLFTSLIYSLSSSVALVLFVKHRRMLVRPVIYLF